MHKFNRKIKDNRGMTYVEIIVVLSIFAVMSSIVLFNYDKFQDKVNIKVLANDIALKIVEAQKLSLSGQLPSSIPLVSPWKPSYGVYFNPSTDLDTDKIPFNKKFIYFTDLDQDSDYVDSFFCSVPGTGECLDKINITKNNYISKIETYFENKNSPIINEIKNPLTIIFTRPNSSATFMVDRGKLDTNTFDYIQITVSSPSLINSYIKIYPSGRVQIN